jgi:hypothetical protein
MMTTAYEQLLGLGAASLEPNEFWCVYHPDGPLEQTASKRFDVPIVIVCEALKADWDDLREQGYSLGKITREPDNQG